MRYAKRFDGFPFRHVLRDILPVLPAQVRGATGEIRIPEAARKGDYDLVCFGSPTWWFKTNLPLRSYLNDYLPWFREVMGRHASDPRADRAMWRFGMLLRAPNKMGLPDS